MLQVVRDAACKALGPVLFFSVFLAGIAITGGPWLDVLGYVMALVGAVGTFVSFVMKFT